MAELTGGDQSEHSFSPESKRVPPAVYTAIIVNSDGKLLLSKRARGGDAGKYGLISGLGSSIKYNLGPAEGVIKEVFADLNTLSYKGEEIFKTKAKISETETVDNHVFVGTVPEDEIERNPKYSDELIWVSPEAALELELAFKGEHAEIIEKYIQYLADRRRARSQA